MAQAGPVDGRPVVLQHGFPQHWYEWRHLIGPLAGAGFRVVVPDFRGFGWSEHPPDEDFRKETLVDDLIALSAELGHERIAFVGHDWGCWVGWLTCLRRPELIERAVLLSVRPPFAPGTVDAAALARLARLWYQGVIAGPLPRAAKLRFFGAMLRRGASGQGLSEIDVYLDPLSQPAQMRAATLLYRQFLTRELPALLGDPYAGRRLPMPIRFIVGRDEPLYHEGMATEAAPHADDYAGEVLPGVGHFLPEEAPDLLRDRVLSFLA